jgi:hypothetical protein
MPHVLPHTTSISDTKVSLADEMHLVSALSGYGHTVPTTLLYLTEANQCIVKERI